MTDLVYPLRVPNPRAVLGYDGSDFRCLRVDTSGNLYVVLTSAPTSVTSAATVQVQEASSPGGTRFLLSSSPAAGKLWRFRAVALQDTLTALSLMSIGVYDGTNYYHLEEVLSPSAGRWISFTHLPTIAPGEQLFGMFFNTTAGDGLLMNFCYEEIS